MRFNKMSDGELVDFVKAAYQKYGIAALSYDGLKKHPKLYTTLYQRGLRQVALLERLNLAEEYSAWKRTQPFMHKGELRERWTWTRVLDQARDVQRSQGFLPPAAWWQANGQAAFVQAVYVLGRSWEDLRAELGDFRSSQFVESRNGLRWRSHAEASLSNFLHARGVPHRRGERYPSEYEAESGRTYGMYDMHFDGSLGPVDIEIWGDKPNGTDAVAYQAKRLEKERFNANNTGFLGIHFTDCYSERHLTDLLKGHIGIVEPFRFDKPTDRLIPSTHWSNADELLEYCKDFAAGQPNGIFPTEEWLRKRGKWSKRPGPAYNTLSVYIKTWLGGVRKLRDLLGQGHASTVKWDRAEVLRRWQTFRSQHGITPNTMRARSQRGQAEYPREALREAGILVAAVSKYAGGSAAADVATGFKPNRKKARR